jgi:hypothetical protein
VATTDEIRAWARDQGMNVSDRGRLSGTVVAAYEEATGDLGEVEDLSPSSPGAGLPEEPASPFVPGDVKDPKPARTRQPKRARKTTPPQVMADIQGKTAFMLSMPAAAWSTRDPFCGQIALAQVPDISRALAGLFAQSPEIVEWFTGKGGNFMAWLDLAAACQPVLMAVIGHHVTHTAGPQDETPGRFATPDDQIYAA